MKQGDNNSGIPKAVLGHNFGVGRHSAIKTTTIRLNWVH